MRIGLKTAIVESGTPQRYWARRCRITERRFSDIVCGWTEPRDAERHFIAAALGRSASALFKNTMGAEDGGSGEGIVSGRSRTARERRTPKRRACLIPNSHLMVRKKGLDDFLC